MSSSLEAGERVWMHALKKQNAHTSLPEETPKPNCLTPLIIKKKSVINIFIMQSEERQQGSFRHNSGTVYIRRPPPLSTVSQQDSQTETLRDKFYIVYLRTACSISWSLLFDMYHLCSRQSLVNRNTKVFIVLHCSLAAL